MTSAVTTPDHASLIVLICCCSSSGIRTPDFETPSRSAAMGARKPILPSFLRVLCFPIPCRRSKYTPFAVRGEKKLRGLGAPRDRASGGEPVHVVGHLRWGLGSGTRHGPARHPADDPADRP